MWIWLAIWLRTAIRQIPKSEIPKIDPQFEIRIPKSPTRPIAHEPAIDVLEVIASTRELEQKTMTPAASLRAIKVLHTIVWAFFVGCIIGIPILGYHRRFVPAAVLISVVLIEVLILVANRLRCPLTGMAARYTTNRKDNFDIYLPVWVARHNKFIFGLLFVGGMVFTLCRWAGWF